MTDDRGLMLTKGNAVKINIKITLAIVGALGFSTSVMAESKRIEEIVVTAQRFSESIQDVPIAVTAMTGEMLENKGVLTPSDLQMNSPSLTFTPTNFGGSSFSIRGIGNLVIGGESGVSTHINEIAIASNLNAIEFYDMARVEVLRGPQGTLFGRNATGGAVNFVTKRPDFESINGFLDLEGGDYNNRRIKGAINLPITDNFAVRVAGMMLERDGYTDNLAFGQVADFGVGAGVDTIKGIDDNLDGRDINTFRVTGEWAITENANLWVMYSNFSEDDDRARITNQICVTNSVPTTGCTPDGVGFETPHAFTGTGGIIFGSAAGAYGPPAATVPSKYQRPAVGLRTMHTDFDPIFQEDEDIYAFGFDYDFGKLRFGMVGAYQEREYLAQQDYYMDVGASLFGGAVNFPVSKPAGGAGADFTSSTCNYNAGTSGATAASNANGGCTLDVDGTVYFAFDQASYRGDYYTVEAKVMSALDGPFNFVVGANAYENESNGDYYVLGNSLDVAGAYPGFFNNTDDPAKPVIADGYAVFGEGYYDFSDKLKFTLGVRYNEDHREDFGTNILFNSFDLNGALGGALGAQTLIRTPLAGFVTAGAALGDANTALVNLYGVTAAEIAAASLTAPVSPERIALASKVPPVPQGGEARVLSGSPTEFEFTEFSGRVGFDYQISGDSMMYAFLSRGYKPGGLNPAIPVDFQSSSKFSFAPEEITAWEIGSKNAFLDGTMVVNGAVYLYDYSGLQVTRIVNNSSINENIDANIMGLELEMQWQPEAIPNLALDAAYSWTHTEVDGATSIDPTNRDADQDASWVLLNNVDSGATTGVNYIANRGEYDAAMALAGANTCSAPDATGALSYPDGIVALQSRNCLAALGVTTSDGLPSNIDGNQLPNTPEHNVKVGAAYTWPINVIQGSLTFRWDYYWQGEAYAREFNTKGDEINSWDQHNAQIIYVSDSGMWSGRLFVRNLQNEDNVTGHYLTSDTSGFYRNYFLTEPRIFGLSVRYDLANN
ncbi:MAG: iron complex outermembrane receptor protein [Candidatus Azotimanducaceae bacterium]